VLAVDGMAVLPGVSGEMFPVCPGQRVDLALRVPAPVQPVQPVQQAWAVLAQWAAERNRTGLLLVDETAPPDAAPPTAQALPGRLACSAAPPTDFRLESRLRAAAPAPDAGLYATARTVRLNLTSGWVHGFSLDSAFWDASPSGPSGMGKVVPNPHPIEVRLGEQVCLLVENQGHGGHPLHLHGHSFWVLVVAGARGGGGGAGVGGGATAPGGGAPAAATGGALRDTVQLPPRCHTAKVCVTANNPGEWLLHCHMLEHSEHGMVTSVRYVE
jgi:FtsP/CotA-like multicopper oxidase with cupredoxin domain